MPLATVIGFQTFDLTGGPRYEEGDSHFIDAVTTGIFVSGPIALALQASEKIPCLQFAEGRGIGGRRWPGRTRCRHLDHRHIVGTAAVPCECDPFFRPCDVKDFDGGSGITRVVFHDETPGVSQPICVPVSSTPGLNNSVTGQMTEPLSCAREQLIRLRRAISSCASTGEGTLGWHRLETVRVPLTRNRAQQALTACLRWIASEIATRRAPDASGSQGWLRRQVVGEVRVHQTNGHEGKSKVSEQVLTPLQEEGDRILAAVQVRQFHTVFHDAEPIQRLPQGTDRDAVGYHHLQLAKAMAALRKRLHYVLDKLARKMVVDGIGGKTP